MTYFGGWYAQNTIWTSAGIGASLVAIVVRLARMTVTLSDKTRRTLKIPSGIRIKGVLPDKSQITLKMRN